RVDLQCRQLALCADSADCRNPRGPECRWPGAQAQKVELGWPQILPAGRATGDDPAVGNHHRCQSHPGILSGPASRYLDDDCLWRRWGVEPNRYVLYVSRLEPENNAHLVIEAFKRVRTAHKLVIVGDAPYARDYINDLKARARRDKRIVFTGFVFGRDYR